jgi:hypothetical protein
MLRELEVWELEEVNGGECRSLICRAWEFLKDVVFINELLNPFGPRENPDGVLMMHVEDRWSSWTAPDRGMEGMR